MQLLTLLTLSATALAQTPASVASSLNPVSVNAVLATALPQSVINAIATNSPAAISSIYSQFTAGNTPSWFAALPTEIQTYLVPVTTIRQVPGGLLSAFPTQATALQTVSFMSIPAMNTSMPAPFGNGTMLGNGTIATMSMRNSSMTSSMLNTMTSSGSMSSSGMMTTSSMTVGGNTAAPTTTAGTGNGAPAGVQSAAVLGAGLAGVAGMLGLLAL